MAQLDKTFPTNDCAMCILSPKLVAAARHPNIELITNAEVTKLEGEKGNFKVQITKHPKFVDEEKCIGCGQCAEKCPVRVPNEFDEGMGDRKAIYVPFPQAVPLIYKIDKENCLYFNKGVCKVCKKVCPADAPDFEQETEFIDINAGAVIVTTGYDQIAPEVKKEYGYGQYKNIIHALQFERILSASGPTGGKLLRPSDNSIPKKIAFIQCVGSRDINQCDYCSRVCCMYAIKTAVIAKEHEPSIEEIEILYMDIRTYGKDFEQYYHRAEDEVGIKFSHGRPAEVAEDPDTKDIVIKVGHITEERVEELKANLVVLCAAIVPSKGTAELAEVLGIDLDKWGFFKEKHINGWPIDSTREGIYIAGCCTSPKDIPDSVAEASAAAARAAQTIPEENRFLETELSQIELIDVSGEPRVGVFVCHCGINIGGIVDVPQVTDYVKTIPGVAYAEHNLFSCSEDTQRHIQDMIKEHKLNRVIVASCTPRTHEPIFRDTCEKAGLNPYLFEMANIRDQCSWVHMHEPEEATEKAKDLVNMAVARSKLLQPLQPKKVDVEKSALVIGGGIAGIESAIDLSNQGYNVTLVEKMAFLGGRVAQLAQMFPEDQSAVEVLDEKYKLLVDNNVNILTKSTVTDVKGFIGNFEITITQRPRGVDIEKCNECGECAKICPVRSAYIFDRHLSKRKAVYEYPNGWPKAYNIVEQDCTQCGECAKVCPTGAITEEVTKPPENKDITIKVGTIVVAIGAEMYKPEGEYCYHDDPELIEGGKLTVISNLGLARLLNPQGPTNGEFIVNDRKPESVAFILCVGSRDPFCKPLDKRTGADRESIGDCSRYCCHTTMKQAIQLRKQGVKVYVLYVDIRTYGEYGEEMYRSAAKQGVQFLKYSFDNKPKVKDLGGEAEIEVFDHLTGDIVKLNVDTVVLALGMVARYPDTPDLLKLLKVPQCGSGFCMEKHVKLAPLETNTDGIYLAGCLQSPKSIAETLAQGSGSAAKAAIPLSQGQAIAEPAISSVDEELCTGCGTCEMICPYNAIRVDMEDVKAKVMDVLCKGCGSCSASCPEKAITMLHFTDEQLIAQGIAAIVEEPQEDTSKDKPENDETVKEGAT
jgi:heterodisulfide reductase subunit A-like polyferredoxin